MKTELWSKQTALNFLQSRRKQLYTEYFLNKYVCFFDKAISCNVPESIEEDKFTDFLLFISSCPETVTALNRLYRSTSCDILFAFYTRHLLLEDLLSDNESGICYDIEVPVQEEFDQYAYLLWNFFNLITNTTATNLL